MEDNAIKKLVLDELEWEPSVDAADVGVTVEKGIVRLTGHVATYSERVAAEAAVKRVKGVRGFVQDLEIRPYTPAFGDEAVAARVANVLDWAVSVPKDCVKCKVDNGMVTLTGEVKWNYQRTAAEQAVRPLGGVRGLINQITVKPTVQASGIKRQIEAALHRQAQLEADQVQVTVDGDKVRLDGSVKAWFERAAIERAAWAAPGVRSVEDHIRVSI